VSEDMNKLLGILSFDMNPVQANATKLEQLVNQMGASGQKLENQFKKMSMGAYSGQNLLTTEQATKRMFDNIENRAKQHKTFMDKVFSNNYFAHHLNFYLTTGAVFGALHVASEALVQVEKGMKGLITVLPELHHDHELYNKTSRDAIDLMQKYGASVDEVLSSARSLGRMYKDVNTVMGLTNNSILLNVIDNVRLEDAVRGNEAALSIYGKELKSTNEVLAFSGKLMDSLTRLSHESMAQASDLIQILQQAGGAAKGAKVEMDQLLGLGASAVRATGLQNQGGNLGRMLRTVFVQLSAPTKAVEETIEKIGVKMRNTNGELRSAYDIILDLSLATKDAKISQEDLNNAMLKASSGKFQYSKLAALMGQFDEIVKNTARSVNSQGITMQMAAQQLDTIERKAKMLKATLIDTFSGAGDAGLRSAIKGMIDTLNQLFMGLNKVSATAINASLGLGAFLLAGKMIFGTYSRVLPILGGVTGATATMAGASAMAASGQMSLATATNISSAAMSRLKVTTALATGGLTILLGAIALAVYQAGEAEKKQLELSQANRDSVVISQQKAQQYQQEADFLGKMAQYREILKQKTDSGNLSEAEAQAVKKDMIAVEEALEIALGNEASARLKAAQYTDKAIKDEKDALKSKSDAEFTALRNTIKTQESQTQAVIDGAVKRIETLQKEGVAIKGFLAMEKKAADIGTDIWNFDATSKEKMASFLDSVGLNNLADKQRLWAEKSRQLANERMQSFNNEVARETERQVTKQEKIIAKAHKDLLELRGSALFAGVNNIEHVPGGGDDDKKPKISDLTDPLKESVNEARSILTYYSDAVSLADDKLRDFSTQEKTLDLYIKNQKIPTLEQARQKYILLNDAMAANTEKQKMLHNEATMSRVQLYGLTGAMEKGIVTAEDWAAASAVLSEEEKQQMENYVGLKIQMADWEAKHRAGLATTKEYNAAMTALRGPVNEIERNIRRLGNAYLELDYNTVQAKDAQADMVRTFIRSTRELQKENALDALAKSQKSALDTMEQQKKKALDDLEEAQKARIRSLESSRDTEINSLKATKDAYEETSNAKIKAIQAEIDALELENDLLNEQEELLSRQKAVEEARTKIANIEADKKIRVVGADGQWTYIADETALREARKDLESAEKALADTQADIRKNARRRELDAQIKQEQDIQKTQLDSYDKQIEAARKAWDDKLDAERDAQQKEKNQQQQAWDKRLDDFREAQANEKATLESHWAGMLDAERINQDAMNEILRLGLDGALTKWRNYYDQVKSLQQAQQPAIPIGGSGGSIPTPTQSGLNSTRIGSDGLTDYTRAVRDSLLSSGHTVAPRSLDVGGPVLYNQMARIHRGEYMLNAQTVRALGGFAGVERLVATINMSQSQWRMPQINPAQSPSSITNDRRVQIWGDIKLPHVYDASGLIRNLEQYAAAG